MLIFRITMSIALASFNKIRWWQFIPGTPTTHHFCYVSNVLMFYGSMLTKSCAYWNHAESHVNQGHHQNMHMVRTAFVYTCSWLGGKKGYIYSFGTWGRDGWWTMVNCNSFLSNCKAWHGPREKLKETSPCSPSGPHVRLPHHLLSSNKGFI